MCKASLEAEVNDLGAKNGISETKLKRSETELGKATTINNVLVAANQKLMEKVRGFETELKKLGQEISKKEQELDAMGAQMAKKDAFTKERESELGKMAKKVEENRLEIAKLTEENGQLKAELAKSQDAEKALGSENKSLKAQMAETGALNEKLKAANFELIQQAKEADERAEHTDKEVERAVAEAKSASDAEKKDLISGFDAQREKLEAKIQGLKHAMDGMPKTDEEATRRMREAEESAEFFKGEHVSLSSRLSSSREDLDQIKKRAKSLLAEIEGMANSRMPLIGTSGLKDLALEYRKFFI